MRDEKGRFTKKVSGIEGLPEKWCIHRKDYPEVQEWFCENATSGANYREYLNGWMTCYPSFGNGNYSIPNVPRDYKEITIEQFRKYVLTQKEEFKLPDKWTINIRKLSQEEKDIVGRYFSKHSGHDCYLQLHYFGYISSHNNVGEKITECHGCTKEANFADFKKFEYITFEEFEKYVLSQDKQQVIGYKFKQSMKKYEAAALAIAKTREWNPSLSYDVQKGCMSEEYLASANVLDEWFDAVYKPEYPVISIGGYDAKFEEDGFVQFGCKRFTKEEVLGFGNVLVKSGLKIETYNDQVLDVYRYFKKKS